MTARSPDPAAEAVSALREALATHFGAHEHGVFCFARASKSLRDKYLSRADGFMARHVAPLLADIAALRTRVEEAERERDRLAERVVVLEADKVALRNALTEMRGRQAEVLSLLKPAEARPCDCQRCDCGNQGDAARVVAWDEQKSLFEIAARALDTATGETK